MYYQIPLPRSYSSESLVQVIIMVLIWQLATNLSVIMLQTILRNAVAKLAQSSFPWYWKLQRKKDLVKKAYLSRRPMLRALLSIHFILLLLAISPLLLFLFWKRKYVSISKIKKKETKNPTKTQSNGKKRKQIKLLANCGDVLKL